jgi:hypothetical protein
MSKPDTVFFGKVFDRKSAPDDDRKVLSLDKGEKRADGTWKNIRPVFIEYEDGSRMTFGEHLVMKKVDRGTQIATLYFNIFPDDEAKPSDFKDF